MNIFAKENGWIHGLKIVAVAIVAHAILGMALKLTPDLKRKTIALFALVVALLWQTEFTQIIIILLSAFIGYFLFKQSAEKSENNIHFPISRRFATICLVLFFMLAYWKLSPWIIFVTGALGGLLLNSL